MKKAILFTLCAVVLTVGSASAQFNTTGTTNLSVVIGPEASIQILTGTTNLTIPGSTTIFDNYTGSTSFAYKIRTTKSGGTGTVQLQITGGDFVGAASGVGPKVANGDLTFACTVTAPATTTGTKTITTTGGTNCATFGANAHSLDAGTGSNTVNWTLTNKPTFETDTYTATATFTIAAL